MKTRRARFTDATEIHALIAHYAGDGILLPRTEENIRENAERFLVLEDRGHVVGCVALEDYGSDLAEIRSLAVSPEFRGRGLGVRLVQYAVAEARRRKIPRVFAVTHAADFFVRQGFAMSSRQALPEKIMRDCCSCAKSLRCQLVAVIATVVPERVTLPVLGGTAASSPVV